MNDVGALRSSPVAWLTAQAVVFGAMAALLGIVANAMFLDAYGSTWLPVTYIVIGFAGVAISAAIRRGAERFDLLRLAFGVLAGAAGLFLLSWLVAGRADGDWVSAPLLVLFPILIQLGFVFIGGQAGRVLDVAGIKASFPRIMAGFPVGATLGGLAALPLVDWFGPVEDLLFVTAVVQGAFAALVWATGRRFAALLAAPGMAAASAAPSADHDERTMSLRALLSRPFIALVLAYQVLSALASQVADFLVFDRASAAFPAEEDLGRFVAGYTALMNGVAITFLFVAAGPLLRRHGLRVGITANPLVDVAAAVAIMAVLAALGPASFGLLAVVAGARIADVVLTDGMTRTSINALYQVLPARQRLAAQTTVEGMGVPVAIGASGVLILVLAAVPDALGARIVVLAAVCGAWSWVAFRVYRAYGPALTGALRNRQLLDPDAPIDMSPADVVALHELAASTNPRAARLARELAQVVASPAGSPAAAAAVPPLGSRAVGDGAVAADAAVPAMAEALDAARVLGAAAVGGPDGDVRIVAGRMVRALRTSSPTRDAVLAANVDHSDRLLGLLVLERLAGSAPGPLEASTALERAAEADAAHAERILAALVALSGEPARDPDGVVTRALEEELALTARRVVAGVMARHGRDLLGDALTRLARDPGHAALAAEAIEVALGRETAAAVLALVTPGLAPRQRLARLPSSASGSARARPAASAWLVEIAADADDEWRSPWLRACAIRALRVSGSSVREVAPGANEDPMVAEELALVRLRNQGRPGATAHR